MLTNSTKAKDLKDLVVDPFRGSGSALIVCEELGRSCRMLEFAPRYCGVIVRRWEDLNGK